MHNELDLLKGMIDKPADPAAPPAPPANDPAPPKPADPPNPFAADPPSDPAPPADPNAPAAPDLEAIRAEAVREASVRLAKEHFGADDITVAAQKYKEANERSTKALSLFKEKANPFVDDEVRSFNTFVKNTGVKSFNTFKKVSEFDSKVADPLETIAMARSLKSERLRGMESEIKAAVLSKYDVETIEDLKADKTKYINFLMEVDEASVEIEKFKTLSLTPSNDGEEFDFDSYMSKETESKQAIKAAWEPALGKLLASKKITLPALTGMEEGVQVDLTDAEVAEFTQLMLDEAVNGGVQASEEGFKNKIYPALINRLIARKFDTIMSGYVSQAVAMTEEQRDKYFSRVRKPEEKYNPGDPKPKEKSASELALETENGR